MIACSRLSDRTVGITRGAGRIRAGGRQHINDNGSGIITRMEMTDAIGIAAEDIPRNPGRPIPIDLLCIRSGADIQLRLDIVTGITQQ